ncbi:MAG: hypothetical protein LAT51_04495 [Flavobacteriaceae bacterium]|nr:hypothetical protein [Flavobacteriaceae bacterium]
MTKSIFWGLVSCMIIPALVTKYNFTGNHTFVTLYMAVLFLIASFYKKFACKILELNARNLLCIMMLFAVVQKSLSKSFMNASSVSFLNLKGGFFTHFHRFFPENQKIINSNNQLISEQTKSIDGLSNVVELTPVNWFFEFNPSFAVGLILGGEIIFLLLLFVKNQYLRNTFFILFMIGLIATRIETGFASLLCILLFMQARKDHFVFQLTYIGLFALYISLILSKLGYH